MNDNKLPRFISYLSPEAQRANTKVLIAFGVGQVIIGFINFFYKQNLGSGLPYLIIGFIMIVAYFTDNKYNKSLGILFENGFIKFEQSRKMKGTIVGKEIDSIQIKLLEIDFKMKNKPDEKIELGNFAYKTIKEIKELSLEFAKQNDIPVTQN